MGFEARKPRAGELEEMKRLLSESLRDGVPAISTGRSYAPGCFSEAEEVIELAKVVAEHGGLYTTDMGWRPFEEVLRIAEESSAPVQISHYNGRGVEEARERGLDITFDAYPYTAGSSFIVELMPDWAWEGGLDQLVERIEATEARSRLRDWFKAGPKARLEVVVISWVPEQAWKRYEGRFLLEIAQSEKVDPVDFLCDLIVANNGVGMYIARDGRTERYVFDTLRSPYHYVMSDGWSLAPYGPLNVGKPHPRAYGAFPRVLGWYVRDCNAIPLQEAVRKMTSAPAWKMGLKDRGLIREGLWADITIFNPKTIIDRATFQEPHQYPVGVDYVILNGQLVIDKGEHTGALPGKVLRRL